MNPGQNWLEIDDLSYAHAQQELYPLDSWGAAQMFSVIDWPHAAVARAMVGPLRLGDFDKQSYDSLRCLAVTADGEFAACVRLTGQELGDTEAMWTHVAHELDMHRGRLLCGQLQLATTPKDCMRAWSNPEFWIPLPVREDPVHRSLRSFARLMEIQEMANTAVLTDEQRLRVEQEAQAAVVSQVGSAVISVLRRMRRDLFEVISSRRRVSISLVHRLLALARQHSPSAITFAMQAITTESLPLLHLAASGYPQQESRQVREALFSGHSLPSTLAGMGVSKAAHRRSLRKPSNSAERTSGAHNELSELPLSGSDWLTVMRTVETRLPGSASDWSEFRRLVTGIFSLDVRDPAIAHKLLRWCLAPGYRRSVYRLKCLVALARTVQMAATRLAHMEPTLDQAISLAMTQVDDSQSSGCRREGGDASADLAFWPPDAGQLSMLVSRISGQSIEQLTKSLFDAYPGLPSGLQLPADTTVEALSSVPAIVSHGTACRNCLQDAERAIQYVADGLALYAVAVNGRIEGTIALRGHGFNWSQKVRVREVTGVDNTDPSPDLSRLAAALADGWTTDDEMAAWLAYDRACERWKQSLDESTHFIEARREAPTCDRRQPRNGEAHDVHQKSPSEPSRGSAL